MSYPPPADDNNDPATRPFGYPIPSASDYGQQPPVGYPPQPDGGQSIQAYGLGPSPAQYGYGYGYPAPAPAQPTNGVAIASLVVSCAAVLGLCAYGLGGYLGIVGAILGHVGRRQIRERGDGGAGLALAGVIVGWIATAVALIATAAIIFVAVWASRQDGGVSPSPLETF